jgi:hypothetical protein
MKRPSHLLVAGLLWGFALVMAAPPAADARVIHIAGVSFVAATSDVDQQRGETFGMLIADNGKLFANVPIEGGTITKFTLCARDFDALDVTARLIAKPVNSFTEKTVMAQVSTTGSDMAVRCFSTTAITQPAVSPTSFAYFAELEFVLGNNIEVTGVQVEYTTPSGVLVTGAGAGGGPHVRVFRGPDGVELFSFFAYDPGFIGGVRVAACDLNGDGVPDIVTGVGPGGGPQVRAFDGVTGQPLAGTLGSFFVYSPAFAGGVDVGCGTRR